MSHTKLKNGHISSFSKCGGSGALCPSDHISPLWYFVTDWSSTNVDCTDNYRDWLLKKNITLTQNFMCILVISEKIQGGRRKICFDRDNSKTCISQLYVQISCWELCMFLECSWYVSSIICAWKNDRISIDLNLSMWIIPSFFRTHTVHSTMSTFIVSVCNKKCLHLLMPSGLN